MVLYDDKQGVSQLLYLISMVTDVKISEIPCSLGAICFLIALQYITME